MTPAMLVRYSWTASTRLIFAAPIPFQQATSPLWPLLARRSALTLGDRSNADVVKPCSSFSRVRELVRVSSRRRCSMSGNNDSKLWSQRAVMQLLHLQSPRFIPVFAVPVDTLCDPFGPEREQPSNTPCSGAVNHRRASSIGIRVRPRARSNAFW